jgi:STE24 endopeptidase
MESLTESTERERGRSERERPSLRPPRPVAMLALLAAAALWLFAAYLLWSTTVPDSVTLPDLDAGRFFSDSFLDRSAAYARFLALDGLLATAALVVVLVLYARRGHRFMRESAAGRVGTGIFLAMLGFCLAWLSQVPFGLAAVWWQRRYDVSHHGYLEWLVNSFLGLGGRFIFVALAFAVAMGLAGVLRRWWWLVVAPIFVAIGLLFTFLSPYLIPGTRPLEDRRLVADARALEHVQGVDEARLRVQEVHDFTDAPNAMTTGFGPTSTVILWDTLLDGRFSDEEIRVVLAHEIGHIAHDDPLKRMGWLALFLIPGWGIVALVSRRRGGFARPQAIPLALLVLIALQLLITPAFNVISRRDEAAADWAAIQSTQDPRAEREAMNKLATTSLSDPDPPSWMYVLFENHPTIMQRIAMADAWEEWSGRR